MAVIGLKNMSVKKLNRELKSGARFVVYTYAISVIFLTFKQGSSVHFVPSKSLGVAQGLPYSLITFLFGWWGIPWGPISSIEAIVNNFRGGIDVTDEMRCEIRDMLRYDE